MPTRKHTNDHLNDFKLLGEAGFLAIKQGDMDSAEKLLFAAKQLIPDHISPIAGLGYVALHAMDLVRARELFEQVLKIDPKNVEAKLLIGFCCVLSKVSYEWMKDKSISREEASKSAHHGVELIKEGLNDSHTTPEAGRFGISVLGLLAKFEISQSTPLKST